MTLWFSRTLMKHRKHNAHSTTIEPKYSDLFRSSAISNVFFPVALIAIQLFNPAWSQTTPSERPLRLVVPYAPGGNVDITARTIAPGLSQILGQPVVVENKPGAGGLLAGEAVARSTPDGLTLFISSNGPVLHSPLIYDRPVYDWRKDFAPVGSVSFTPMVLLATADFKANTLPEMLSLARLQPAKLTIATPGAGSTNHLAAELLQMEQGVTLTTIHYKGTAPAMADLLGGHVQLSFDQISAALPLIRNGKVKALAVTTSNRLPQLPGTPTFEEAGIKNFQVSTFVGLFAPAATPRETVTRLNSALTQVLTNKAVIEKFDTMGAQAQGMPPKSFTSYLEEEDSKWIPVIKKSGIKVN
jgi:tripartite-type tricarboxylate transporter receptor subunit TctC